jgi:P27 family predicted phage terminase small subunit
MARKHKAGLLAKIPRAPEYFAENARVEWTRLLKILVEDKLVTTLDLNVLEGACLNYGIYRDMYDAITLNGTRTMAQYIDERGGNSQKQGELTTMNKAFDQYTKVLRLFGATPAARRIMKLTDKERSEENTKDPLEDELGL